MFLCLKIKILEKLKGGFIMPFILLFLEKREGVIAATTCGTWSDIDAGDIL